MNLLPRLSAAMVVILLAFLFGLYGQVGASAPGGEIEAALQESASEAVRKPHIVVVMVDDLGWSSVGFNMAPEQRSGPGQVVQTPEIDKLASTGVVLKRHYAGKMCAPSRSSFMTGRFPIHVNQLNHKIFEPGTGLPLGMSTIAEMLGANGYATHHVGKWHLGMSSMEFLPVRRGFNTSLALLSGSADHFTLRPSSWHAYPDLWLNDGPAKDLRPPNRDNTTKDCVPYSDIDSNETEMCKTYSQDTYMKHTKDLIQQHDASVPMFLFLALQMPHGPLQAPNRFLDFYSNKIWKPRRFAYAMISSVDEVVKDLQLELERKGMWKDTLFLFTSDNGGSREHEANYPLRGAKGTDFEGGVRVASFVAGGFLPNEMRGRTLSGLMHICDWWATFASLAGVSVTPDMEDPRSKDETRHGRSIPKHVKTVDSLNMWPYISGSVDSSPRQIVVLSGGEEDKDSGALIDGRWKLIVGKQLDASIPCPTTPDKTDDLEWVAPFRQNQEYMSPINCGRGCLFDLDTDERELHDLRYSMEHRDILLRMQKNMSDLRKTFFQAHTVTGEDKENAKSVSGDTWDRFWGPWQEDLPGNALTGVKVKGRKMKLDTEENPIKNLTAASDCRTKCESYGTKCKAWSYLGGPGIDGSTLCTLFKVLFNPPLLTRFSWVSEVMDDRKLAKGSVLPATQKKSADVQAMTTAVSSSSSNLTEVREETLSLSQTGPAVREFLGNAPADRSSQAEEQEQEQEQTGPQVPSVVFIAIGIAVLLCCLILIVIVCKCRQVKDETSAKPAASPQNSPRGQHLWDCAATQVGLEEIIVRVPSGKMPDDEPPVAVDSVISI